MRSTLLMQTEINEFIDSIPANEDDIDFICISIDGEKTSYKAYIAMDIDSADMDIFSDSDILSAIYHRGMIYHLETIYSKNSIYNNRYDIALKNKTDENIEYIFDILNRKKAFSHDYEETIRKISSFCYIPKSNHKYKAFFHLGADGKSEILKFYFKMYDGIRNHVTYLDRKNDFEYIDFLSKIAFNKFNALIPVAHNILQYDNCSLWMTGLDISKKGIEKYKIYIKVKKNIYVYLQSVFNKIFYNQIEQIAAWNESTPRYRLCGVALGIDKAGKVTLNLYYYI